jgi:hypothetical protein
MIYVLTVEENNFTWNTQMLELTRIDGSISFCLNADLTRLNPTLHLRFHTLPTK